MNILVTGGAGFNPDASQYILDILDDRIESVFQEFKPEVVIHQAAQINVQTSIKRPKYDAEVNILGSIALLENCRKYGVRKVIYASSAAVYGRTGVEAVRDISKNNGSVTTSASRPLPKRET